MLRTRKYRVFLIFSVIVGFAFLRFLRSRDWPGQPAFAPAPELKIPPPPSTNVDSAASHGFASENNVNTEKPAKAPVQQEPPASGKLPVDPESESIRPPAAERPKPDRPALKPTVDTDEVGHSNANVGRPSKGTASDKQSNEFSADGELQPKPDTSPGKYTINPEEVDVESVGMPSTKMVGDEYPDKFGPTGQGRLEVDHPPTGQPEPHWERLPEHFPVPASELIKLPTGKPKTLPKLQAVFKDETPADSLQRSQRLSAIKEEFLHAWTGYKTDALGHDEVRPVTGGFRDPFAGWGATLVDALDTLWIMGLEDEFADAVEEVKKIDFTTSFRKDIPLFETVIRYLGGLLGAYDISGGKYKVLLDKAVELAEILIGAFDTPNRMPVTYYYWAPAYVSQPHRASARVVLAEIASLSVEFTRLAQLTQEDKYYDAIARITDALEVAQNNTRLPGMWPLLMDASGCKKSDDVSPELPLSKGKPDNVLVKDSVPNPSTPTPGISQAKHLQKRQSGLAANAQPAIYESPAQQSPAANTFTKSDCEEQGLASPPHSKSDNFGLGGQSDSAYEYFSKEYMLLGGLNEQYRSLYEISMQTVRETLLFRPMLQEARDIRFLATAKVSDRGSGTKESDISLTYEGTHLTCFAGGMFAVGAKLFGLDGDMDIAAKLTDGCVWAYESTATGIMPEGFEILPCDDPLSCSWNETKYLDTMDPYENDRIEQAENWYQYQLKIAKQAWERKKQEKPNIVGPVRTPVSQATKDFKGKASSGIEKRDSNSFVVDDYDEHAHLAASKTAPAVQEEVADFGSVTGDSSFVPPPKPTVLSHEDYVAARVKEEHIPPGFTTVNAANYILRPEAIESVFIMFRLTGDEIWREKGWKMFDAIIRHCRTEIAHSAIKDVTAKTPRLSDSMESFWLAETLKYFYLLYSDPSVVSLDEYILNTEAHPFKRPSP